MSKVFLTKVWAFGPEDYPALGFNTPGGRDKFLRESAPGDWVVLAGTRGAPTSPENQGRLLGKVQLGTEQIDVEQILKSIGARIPDDHYLEDGRYRWPYGLPMIAASRFVDRPDVASLFGDYLSGTHWASFALDIEERLGAEARAKVDSLRTEPVAIIEAPELVRQREKQKALGLNRGTGPTGPGPSGTRAPVERECGKASVYLLALRGGRRQVFKIGFCSDLNERVRALNGGLVPSVTGYTWEAVARQDFPTEHQAYAFEQGVHSRLLNYLVSGEREIYEAPRKELDSVWADVFHKGRWATAM